MEQIQKYYMSATLSAACCHKVLNNSKGDFDLNNDLHHFLQIGLSSMGH